MDVCTYLYVWTHMDPCPYLYMWAHLEPRGTWSTGGTWSRAAPGAPAAPGERQQPGSSSRARHPGQQSPAAAARQSGSTGHLEHGARGARDGCAAEHPAHGCGVLANRRQGAACLASDRSEPRGVCRPLQPD
jgi:hypothetical protein